MNIFKAVLMINAVKAKTDCTTRIDYDFVSDGSYYGNEELCISHKECSRKKTCSTEEEKAKCKLREN